MQLLDFTKPQKKRSTEDHNKRYSSDSGIPGTYVPNMSDDDMYKWKAKHIKGDNERIEIRKTFKGTQVLIIVHKNKDEVKMSMNGSTHMTYTDWENMKLAVYEAKEILEIGMKY